MKKFFKITGIVLLILIIAAFLIPILFKKQITTLVKSQINNNLTAKVDFKDVSISLFRHFPNVSILLEDLTVIGTGEFKKDTLLSAPLLSGTANLWSIVRGKNIRVSAVFFESPRIHALVNKAGLANWDISKPGADTSASSDSSEFHLSLKKYEINNGYIFYKDESASQISEIIGLDHEGSGDFNQDIFTLVTTTHVDAASFSNAGVPYLAQTKVDVKADIEVNNSESKYSFKTDDILLNNLKIATQGFVQLVNDSTYNLDVKFNTPANDFKDILSMIPVIYTKDFEKIKTTGKATLAGMAKGIYSPVQLPAYDIKLDVANASFQYPDLPKPVSNIQVALHVTNPDGKYDNTVVDIAKAHLEMDNKPFDLHVIYKFPETQKYVDGAVKGSLDLSQVSQFIKLEKGTSLSGLVNADAFAKGNLSTGTSNLVAGGFFNISQLNYAAPTFPQPIKNGSLKINLSNTGGVADNTMIDISDGHIEVGNDPVNFNLKITQPVSVLNFSGGANGRFTLDNVIQFVTLEEGTDVKGTINANLTFAGTKAAIDKGDYSSIKTNGTMEIKSLNYKSKEYAGGIAVPAAKINFTPATVNVEAFSGNYLNSNFSGNGRLDNIIGYMLKDEPLKGNFDVAVDKMNLNEWMGTQDATTTSTTADADPFLVPSNLAININAKAGNVRYDKVDYQNISGNMYLADQTVKLSNVTASALDGQFKIDGSYSTKVNKKDPAINIAYDVKGLDIQKTFLAFNTVKALMPIGQFLSGNLSSQLAMNGSLKSDMMPDLTSLTGKGNLLLLNGVLRKFAPLEKIASALQINELKEITIKDIKNYIEIANGKVLVKPFTLKVKDIEMEIGGMHGLDKSIDYIVSMKLPRKYLGTQGNNLLNGLEAKAVKSGIPVKLGETVNLNIKLGGSMTNPSIQTDLKEVAGDAVEDLKKQAVDFAKERLDSAKAKAKDSLQSIRNDVIRSVEDELKNRIFNKDSAKTKSTLDSTKTKTETKIKNTLKDILNRKKKPVADTTSQ